MVVLCVCKNVHKHCSFTAGIMLHYDTPALSHLYFVDPQWLCDMLAHIVTVPEVNRFIQRTEGTYAHSLCVDTGC